MLGDSGSGVPGMIWYVSVGCAGGGDSVSDVVRGEDGSALGRTHGMG